MIPQITSSELPQLSTSSFLGVDGLSIDVNGRCFSSEVSPPAGAELNPTNRARPNYPIGEQRHDLYRFSDHLSLTKIEKRSSELVNFHNWMSSPELLGTVSDKVPEIWMSPVPFGDVLVWPNSASL